MTTLVIFLNSPERMAASMACNLSGESPASAGATVDQSAAVCWAEAAIEASRRLAPRRPRSNRKLDMKPHLAGYGRTWRREVTATELKRGVAGEFQIRQADA